MSEIETKKPLETFTLVKERCMLSNLNIRTEMHGDERQRAVDLQFDFSGSNHLLSKLHPDLRHMHYKAQETKDMISDDHTPVLRFPLMGPISWDLEIPRTRLQLHGETPADDVVLGDGKTNKFKLTMLDGGTVKWHFRVQFSNPDDKAIAGLSRFLNDTVPVSLECRTVDEDEGDNFDKAEKLSQAPMSEARQKAEDLFAQPGDVVDNLFATPGTDLAIEGKEGVTLGALIKGLRGEETVTVESVRETDAGDVVDAAFDPAQGGDPAAPAIPLLPADDLDQAPVAAPAASNVAPIGSKRRSTRKAAGGNLE